MRPYNNRPAQATRQACAPKAHMLRKNAALQITCKAWKKSATGGHGKAMPGEALSSIFTPPNEKRLWHRHFHQKKRNALQSSLLSKRM